MERKIQGLENEVRLLDAKVESYSATTHAAMVEILAGFERRVGRMIEDSETRIGRMIEDSGTRIVRMIEDSETRIGREIEDTEARVQLSIQAARKIATKTQAGIERTEQRFQHSGCATRTTTWTIVSS